MVDILSYCRLSLHNRLCFPFPARFCLVGHELATVIPLCVTLSLETEPVLPGNCGQYSLNPSPVNTANRHLPLLHHLGFEGLTCLENDSLFLLFDKLKRRSPPLLVLKFEDKKEEFGWRKVYPQVFQVIVESYRTKPDRTIERTHCLDCKFPGKACFIHLIHSLCQVIGITCGTDAETECLSQFRICFQIFLNIFFIGDYGLKI